MKTEEVEKKTLFKRSVARYALYIALFLLSFIVLNLLIATVLFIFKVSVQSWYVIAAGVLSVGLIIFLMWKRGWLSWKSVMVVVIIPALVFAGLTKVNSKIYDYTWDGNCYHKLAIGMMMDGWNPLYETESEFNSRSDSPIELDGWTFHWGDYYAKASHIFAANVAKLTGNVESGKVINDISIIIVFLAIVFVCFSTGKSWIFTLFFSGIAVSLPTISGQFLTNYVDILLYLYMFLLMAILFGFEYVKEYKKELFALFFMTIVMLINIKFSSFAYAGILCACYYVWYIYRLRKDKTFKSFFEQFTWTAVAAVLVGVFVVGLSVYPRNMVLKGSPFYPLFGSGEKVDMGELKDALDSGKENIVIDIMTSNSPGYFQGKSGIERFVIATFSEMENFSKAYNGEIAWKMPFTISDDEMQFAGYSDLRISGNGVFFSGVLLISLAIVLIGARKLLKEDRKLFIMIMIPLGMTIVMIFTMSESWWARYFPQTHFIVFAAFIMLDRYKQVFAKVVLYGLMGITLVNNIMYFNAAVRISREFTAMAKTNIAYYKSVYSPEECVVSLETSGFPGAYYDGRVAFSEYDIVYRIWVAEDGEEYVALTNPYLIGKCEKK